jgi:hypothetical protein
LNSKFAARSLWWSLPALVLGLVRKPRDHPMTNYECMKIHRSQPLNETRWKCGKSTSINTMTALETADSIWSRHIPGSEITHHKTGRSGRS